MIRITKLALVLGLMTNMSLATAEDRYSDAAYVLPIAKALLEEGLHAIAPEQVQAYVDQIGAYHVFTPFEGMNEQLRTQNLLLGAGPLKGGEIVELDLTAPELLGIPVLEQDTHTYLASITSRDAYAIRLRADLTQLAPGDEVWVIDPRLPRAFGPYAAAEERWLATIQGEEAILMVRTASAEIPAIRLTGYCHIFLPLIDVTKELGCNIDIACESAAAILEASSGTGILFATDSTGGWFCSGTLVNNGLTAELEPFFLTANHCICNHAQTQSMEVYWDYRSSACGVNDAPDRDTLPRSNGDALLATNPELDATLLRLDTVPDGIYGRTYLGWDANLLQVDDPILAIHYPSATHMRISKGLVIGIDSAQGGREKQINVHWDEGVTEGGSSGSCLLLAANNRITGMLSQGPTHSCEDNTGNIDWFASFHEFYPQVRKYLDADPPATEAGENDCEIGDPICPFLYAFFGNREMIADFRLIRDKMLRRSNAGSQLVDIYYDYAPHLAQIIKQSDEARCIFIAITSRLAPIGAMLR